jgi:sugar lactone lactonase YvrE
MIVVIAICVAAFVATSDAGTAPKYTVSTIAGSGLSGVRDGDAQSAQFMKPVGIAADAAGNIYVADAAAQRIRVISPDGNVRTLAGSGAPQFNNTWVTGGYRDGPAAQSRFNRPSAVAVGPDGSVYVADTLNHCIRVIKNGIVSTYSGAPDNTAADDGPIAKASYIRPRALAFDARGDLFVADIAIGIRRISGGNVTTLKLLPKRADKTFVSLAFSGPSTNETMWVGTADQIIEFDRNLKAISRQVVSGGDTLYGMRGAVVPATLDQAQGTGPVFGIAAFDSGYLVFADARDHALRMLSDMTQPETQWDPNIIPDAADFGGGYRDGPFHQAQFDAPMGLAKLPDGSIAIADTGNRRVRKLSLGSAFPVPGDDPTPAASLSGTDVAAGDIIVPGEDPFPGMSTSYYRIAYLGNSYAFFNTRWADSIPGMIESGLRSNWRALGFPRPPKVICVSPFLALSGFHDYISNILSLGVVDAVILQVNAINIGASYPAPHTSTYDFKAYERSWASPVRRSIVEMYTELKKAGIPLLVVVNPTAAHLSSLEVPVVTEVTGFQDWLYLTNGPPSGDTFEEDMGRIVAGSGVPSIDLFPDFLAAEEDAHRLPLFGTMNTHYSENGRALAANTIVQSMIRTHFWRK